MTSGENVTCYLPGDLKARAKAAGVPVSFALQAVLVDVLAALDGKPAARTARVVLDEMERRASA